MDRLGHVKSGGYSAFNVLKVRRTRCRTKAYIRRARRSKYGPIRLVHEEVQTEVLLVAQDSNSVDFHHPGKVDVVGVA